MALLEVRDLRVSFKTYDGVVGAGKSSAARGLARALGYRHLDTGAMYRALALKELHDGLVLQLRTIAQDTIGPFWPTIWWSTVTPPSEPSGEGTPKASASPWRFHASPSSQP